MKKSLIALTVAASLTALTGCGGGSSDSDNEDVSSYTLSGTAAKGVIQQGIVTATELNESGVAIGVVGTAITDDSGGYTLTLNDNYQNGVVKLSISAGENTTMKCDATDGCGTGNAFGASISLGSDFSLDAIVQPDGESVSAQITPLTHMAAARVLATGAVNSTSVATANSEVSQIAGVDIMSTEVIDITDATALTNASDDAKELAIFNAGLADILVSGADDTTSVQENMIANLADLAASFEDGAFDSDDEIGIADITKAVSETAEDIVEAIVIANGLSETEIDTLLSGAVTDVQTAASVINNQTDSEGNYNPEPSGTAELSDTEQAKALLTKARTLIETIAEDVEDSGLESPLDAFDIDPDTIADVLSNDTAVMSALLGESVVQVLNDIDAQGIDGSELLNNIQDGLVTEVTTTITDNDGTTVGEITTSVTPSDSGIILTLTGSLTGNGDEVDDNGDALTAQTVNIDLELATNLTAENFGLDNNEDFILTAITADTANVKVSGSVGNTEVGSDYVYLILDNVDLTVSARKSVTLDTTDDADNSALESEINGASFVGDISISVNGSTFDGDAEIVLVSNTNTIGDVPLSVEKVAVNGSFADGEGDSFSAGAKLEISNANSFDTFGFLTHESTAYKWVEFDHTLSNADSVIVGAAVPSDAELNDIYYHSWSGSYEVGYTYLVTQTDEWNNTFSYSSFNSVSIDNLTDLDAAVITAAQNEVDDTVESTKIDYVNYAPFKYQYNETTYNWERIEDSSYVTAGVKLTFADFETATNFVQGTLTLTAELDVDELPNAAVTVAASRTSFSGGDAEATITYDGTTFTLGVESSDLDAENVSGTITLSNPDGVVVVINVSDDGDSIEGTVSVDGTQVGTISDTNAGPIVRYSDGEDGSYFESLY